MTETGGMQALILETIRSPATAAERLLALRLPQEWLWMALALMSVLNAIVYSISLHLSPPPESEAGMTVIPAAFLSPVLFTIFLFGALTITVFVMHWLGRSLGGAAQRREILILITWLQVLRLVVQVAVLVLSLAVPAFGALVVLVASVWGLYILVVFLDVAHRFDNRWKATGLLLLAVVAIAVGLSLVLGTLGAVIVGGEHV